METEKPQNTETPVNAENEQKPEQNVNQKPEQIPEKKQKKEKKLSQEEWKDCSDRLGEAFGRLKGKLSFCNLH